MFGAVKTQTAADWFRLTRQIGNKQLVRQVRVPAGGADVVAGGRDNAAVSNTTPSAPTIPPPAASAGAGRAGSSRRGTSVAGAGAGMPDARGGETKGASRSQPDVSSRNMASSPSSPDFEDGPEYRKHGSGSGPADGISETIGGASQADKSHKTSDTLDSGLSSRASTSKVSTHGNAATTIVIDFRRYLLDIALEILLGTKPEHVKINVLIFLQEECLSLFCDEKILWCFFTTAKSMLTHPQAFSSLIRGQMLVTATTILIEVDTIATNPSLFRSFVVLLHSVAADTFNASTCYLRQMACESLRELELTYPTVLAEFVSETLSSRPASALPASASSLLRFFQEERSHISQSYALLYLTVLEHAVAEDDGGDGGIGGGFTPSGYDFENDDEPGSTGDEVAQEGQNGDVESFSDDSAYGGGPLADTYDEEDYDHSGSMVEEYGLRYDMAGGEAVGSSGGESNFYTDDEFLDVDTQPAADLPVTPVTSMNPIGFQQSNTQDDAFSESKEPPPLTTSLTASLGNVPTPILREAIAGLVHQLASMVKRPGYSVPEKTAVLIRPASRSKQLFSHFPPTMLSFKESISRAEEDERSAGPEARRNRRRRGGTKRSFFDSVVKKLSRALSLILENSTLFSQWGLAHMITKIVPFSQRMELQPSIFRHHFYGMAFTQSPLLYHIVSYLHARHPAIIFVYPASHLLPPPLPESSRTMNITGHTSTQCSPWRVFGGRWAKFTVPSLFHDRKSEY